MELNKIYQGDCLSFMKTFPDNSIDTIITDPPYHLTSIVKRFGKKGSAPAKYGTDGVFQRASKGFMGKEWDGGDIAFRVELWQEVLRVAKPGATLMAFGGTRTYHRMACAIEDAGWILRDCIMWLYGSGFPKATDIGKQLDKKAGKKREKIKRVRVDGKKPGIIDSYFGGKEFSPKETYSDKPATPEAKLWNGWKSHSLKPAYEPIIVAMKPNDGTYANNALKWGVSGLNIDAGRIGTEDTRQKTGGAIKGSGWGTKKGAIAGSSLGRFPANIILDEEAAKLLDEQSGDCKSAGEYKKNKLNTFKPDKALFKLGYQTNNYANQRGGASRFFYVAKASKKERTCNGRVKNNHPTIKSLKLMEYLCKLTSTPTGGVVLDPFAGSGTTCMACKKLGRPYIGIEQDKEYCKIAEARIEAIKVDNKLF